MYKNRLQKRSIFSKRKNKQSFFIDLCYNCDTKHISKIYFKYTNTSFSDSDVNMHQFSAKFYSGRTAKKRNSNFVGFLKKNSRAIFFILSKIVY